MMTADEVLSFWFDEAGPKKWYKKSDAFDALIRQRFEETVLSLATDVAGWDKTPNSLLALIIALDQFPRNIYRETTAAFAFDDRALGHTKTMTYKGWDLKIDQSRRAFAYMLHHAKEHRKVIERFGRFPHRNAILGRESTAEEIAFLKSGGYAP